MILIQRINSAIKLFIVLAMWITYTLQAEVKDPIILQHADVLQGSETASGPVRELRGNVSLSQGNVSVQCDYAIQYVNQNSVEMSGNVIVKQNGLILSMPSGHYDGFSKLAKGSGGVEINDRGRILKALYGDYNTENYLARFFGNVLVEDDSTKIYADSAYYERSNRNSTAYGNVSVYSKHNKAIIDGNIAYSFPEQGLTRIVGKPILYLIDSTIIQDSMLQKPKVDSIVVPEKKATKKITSKKQTTTKKADITNKTVESSFVVHKTMKYDTMFVSADTLETFQHNGDMYKAKQNVEMIRSSMFALCNNAEFYPNNDSVTLNGSPMIWYDSTVLSADKVDLHIHNKKVEKIDAIGSAFAIMNDDTVRKNRAQQISGKRIEVMVYSDTIRQIISSKDARSLYFRVDDDGNPDGAAKNSSDSIKVRFESGEPESIVWLGGVQGEVFPEHIIAGKENEFDLPGKPSERKKPIKKKRKN